MPSSLVQQSQVAVPQGARLEGKIRRLACTQGHKVSPLWKKTKVHSSRSPSSMSACPEACVPPDRAFWHFPVPASLIYLLLKSGPLPSALLQTPILLSFELSASPPQFPSFSHRIQPIPAPDTSLISPHYLYKTTQTPFGRYSHVLAALSITSRVLPRGSCTLLCFFQFLPRLPPCHHPALHLLHAEQHLSHHFCPCFGSI